MEEIITGYEANSATWLYYSLLLVIAVFFKFNRLWSLRNLDLGLLLAISPGMVWIKIGEAPGYAPPADGMHAAAAGYAWMFGVSLILLFRLLGDGLLKRRPRLEQNLNVSGMTFLMLAAFCFLSFEAIREKPPEHAMETIRHGKEMISRVDSSRKSGEATAETAIARETLRAEDPADQESSPPPTTRAMAGISNVVSDVVAPGEDGMQVEVYAVRTMAILAHLAVISGLIYVGRNQFGDVQLGVTMALMYLLIPSTAYHVHRADHVIPAAFLVWAIAAYRKPIASGALFGLACGAIFFPVFLLPVWLVYYSGRGAKRFLGSLLVTGLVLISTLTLTAVDSSSFWQQLMGTIDWDLFFLLKRDAGGFWAWATDSWWYRLPIFVCFCMMVVLMTFQASKRNLEHLIACSTAIIVGTQFWYADGGGKYVLWYLPLLLLVVFRPRLTHLIPPELPQEDDVHVKLPAENSPSRRTSPTGAQVFR